MGRLVSVVGEAGASPSERGLSIGLTLPPEGLELTGVEEPMLPSLLDKPRGTFVLLVERRGVLGFDCCIACTWNAFTLR